MARFNPLPEFDTAPDDPVSQFSPLPPEFTQTLEGPVSLATVPEPQQQEALPTTMPLRELATSAPDTTAVGEPVGSMRHRMPLSEDPNSAANVLIQSGRTAAASVVRAFGAFGTMVEAQAVQAEARDKAFAAAQKLTDPDLQLEAMYQILVKDLMPDDMSAENLIIRGTIGLPWEAAQMITSGIVRTIGPERTKNLTRNNRHFLEDIEANIKGTLTNDEMQEFGVLADRLATGRRKVERTSEMAGGSMSVKLTAEDIQRDSTRLLELGKKRARLPEELTRKWQESASWKDKVLSADWWLLNGAEQAGPMAAFLISIRMGLRGASAVASQQMFSIPTLKAIGVTSAATAGALASAYLEGAGHYAQRVKQVGEEQAAQEAVEVARAAYAITFATSGLGHGIAGTTTGKFSVVGAVISEPVEETMQAMTGNAIADRPIFEQVEDAFLLSLPFAIFGGIQTVRSNRGDFQLRELEISVREEEAIRQRALEDVAKGETRLRREYVAKLQDQRRDYAERAKELQQKFDETDFEAAREELQAMRRSADKEQMEAESRARVERHPLSGTETLPALPSTFKAPRGRFSQMPGGIDEGSGSDLRLQREIDDAMGISRPGPFVPPEPTARADVSFPQETLSEDATFLERRRAEERRDPTREQRREAAEGALSILARREAELRAFETLFSLERGSDYHKQLMRLAVDSKLATKTEALATDAETLEGMLATNTKKLEMPEKPLEDLREKNIAKKQGLSAVLPTAEETAARKSAGPPKPADFLDKSPDDIANGTTKAHLITAAENFGVDLGGKKAAQRLSKRQIVDKINEAVKKTAVAETKGKVEQLSKDRLLKAAPVPTEAEAAAPAEGTLATVNLPPHVAKIALEYDTDTVESLELKTKREILDDIESLMLGAVLPGEGFVTAVRAVVKRRADDGQMDSRLSKRGLVEMVKEHLRTAPRHGAAATEAAPVPTEAEAAAPVPPDALPSKNFPRGKLFFDEIAASKEASRLEQETRKPHSVKMSATKNDRPFEVHRVATKKATSTKIRGAPDAKRVLGRDEELADKSIPPKGGRAFQAEILDSHNMTEWASGNMGDINVATVLAGDRKGVAVRLWAGKDRDGVMRHFMIESDLTADGKPYGGEGLGFIFQVAKTSANKLRQGKISLEEAELITPHDFAGGPTMFTGGVEAAHQMAGALGAEALGFIEPSKSLIPTEAEAAADLPFVSEAAPDNFAHKGYLVKRGRDGIFYISKDNTHIGSSPTAEGARKIIGELTEETAEPSPPDPQLPVVSPPVTGPTTTMKFRDKTNRVIREEVRDGKGNVIEIREIGPEGKVMDVERPVTPVQIQGEEKAQVEAVWDRFLNSKTQEKANEALSGLSNVELLDFANRISDGPQSDNAILNKAVNDAMLDPTRQESDLDLEFEEVTSLDELVEDGSSIEDTKEFLGELDNTELRGLAEEAGVAVKTAKGNFRSRDTLVNQIADAVMQQRRAVEIAESNRQESTAPEQFWEELGDLAGNTTRSVEVDNDRILEQGKLASGETVYWMHDNTYDTVDFIPAEEAKEMQDEHSRGNTGPSIDYILGLDDEQFNSTVDRMNLIWAGKLADQMGIAQMTAKGTERKSRAVKDDLKKELQAQRAANLPDLNPTKQEQNRGAVLAGPTRAAAPIIDSGISETATGLASGINELAAMATYQQGDPTASHASAGRMLERLRDLLSFKPAEVGLRIRAEVEANSGAQSGSKAMSDLRHQMAGLAAAYRVTDPINKVTRLVRAMGTAFEGPSLKDMDQALSGLENIHADGVDAWADAVGEVSNLNSLPDDQNIELQKERLGEEKAAAIASLREDMQQLRDAGVGPTDPERVAVQDKIRDLLFDSIDGKEGVTIQMSLLPFNVVEVYELFKRLWSPAFTTKIDPVKYPAWARGRQIQETGVELEMAYTESIARMMDDGTFARELVGNFEYPSMRKMVTEPITAVKQLVNSTIMRTVNDIRALGFIVRHEEKTTGKKFLTLSNPESRVILSRGAPGKGEKFAEVWSEAMISSGTGRRLSKDEIANFKDYIFSKTIIRREAAAFERFSRYNDYKLENARIKKGLRKIRGKIESLGRRGRSTKTEVTKVRLRNEKSLQKELLAAGKADLARIGKEMASLKARLIDTDNFDAKQINPDGATAAEAQKTLEQMQEELGDETMGRFEKATKRVNDFWGTMLDYSVEAGLISQEDATRMEDAQDHNGDYLGPFNVVTKWANAGLEEMHKNNLTVMGQDIYMTEKGTTDFVGDMGNASIDRIFKTVGFGERNKAVRELWNMRNAADASEDIKSVIMLPYGPEAMYVTEDHGRWFLTNTEGTAIRGNPKKGHFTQEAAEKQKVAIMGKEGEGLEAPAGFETLYFLDDGKMVQLWAAQPIAYAVKGMNKPMVNWMMRAINSSNQLLRLGATALNLTFTALNLPRDLATQYLAADIPLRFYNPLDWWIVAESFGQFLLPNGLRSKNTKALINAWKENGGSFSGQMQQVKPNQRALMMIGTPVARVTTWNKKSNVAKVVLSALGAGVGTGKLFVEGLTHFAEAAEGATRMGLFKKELRSAGTKRKGIFGQGTTTEGATQEDLARAALASRTGTIDFAQGGALFQGLNYFAPFINAGAQGSRVMINGLWKNKKRAAVWGAIGIAAVTRALTNDYEEYGAEIVNKVDPRTRKKFFVKIIGTYFEDGEELPLMFTFPKGDFLALVTAPIETFIADGYSGPGASDRGPEGQSLGGFSFEEAEKNRPWRQRLQELLLSTVSDISPIEFEREGKFTPELALATPLPIFPKGLLEIGYNKNFYFNSEIEYPKEKSRLSRDRFRKSTTLGARRMAHWVTNTFGEDSYLGSLSPIEIDHLSGTFAAEAGRIVMRAPEALGIFKEDVYSTADRVESPIPLLGGGIYAGAPDIDEEGEYRVKWGSPWVESAFHAVGLEDREIIALTRTPVLRAFVSASNRNVDQQIFAAHEKGSQIVRSREWLQMLDVQKMLSDVKGRLINEADLEQKLSGYSDRQRAMIHDEVQKLEDPALWPRKAKYRSLMSSAIENGERATMMATAMKDALRTNEARVNYIYDLYLVGAIDENNQKILWAQLLALQKKGYWDGRPFTKAGKLEMPDKPLEDLKVKKVKTDTTSSLDDDRPSLSVRPEVEQEFEVDDQPVAIVTESGSELPFSPMRPGMPLDEAVELPEAATIPDAPQELALEPLAVELYKESQEATGPFEDAPGVTTVTAKAFTDLSKESGSFTIRIDPNTNIATLMSDGEEVKTYNIATGDITGTRYGKKWFTPTGKGEIIQKQKRPEGVGQEGPFKLRLSQSHYKDRNPFLLHGPYDAESDIVDEKGAFINKGYLSHGCIRFRAEDIRELAGKLEVGSVVDIVPYTKSSASSSSGGDLIAAME